MRAEFPPNRDTPIRVLVSNAEPAAVAQVSDQLERTEGVVAVNPPQQLPNGDMVVEGISERALHRGREPRDRPRGPRHRAAEGTTVLVTGATADFLDFQQSLEEHLPLAFAIIVIWTLIVLFLMTGSVVLPIKQLIMNVLNLSAVFGILVFIFQDGRLEGLLDYRSQGALEQTMPILLFAVAFGLSTDYGVFLLSRIKEARDNGRQRLRERRARPGANRPHRHRGRRAVRDRDRRLRDLADHLHQAERHRHRARRPDRRDDHPRPAGPIADGAARPAGTGGRRSRCAGCTGGSA